MREIVEHLWHMSPAGVYAVAALLIAAEVGLVVGMVVPAATVMLAVPPVRPLAARC